MYGERLRPYPDSGSNVDFRRPEEQFPPESRVRDDLRVYSIDGITYVGRELMKECTRPPQDIRRSAAGVEESAVTEEA